MATGNLDRSLVDSNDAFVVDSGAEIFVYLGKKASAQEKKLGPKYAMDYMREHNKPAYMPLTVVREGGNNLAFEAVFDKGSRVRELPQFSPPAVVEEEVVEVGESRAFVF